MRKLLRAWARFLGLVWGLPLLVVMIGIALLPKDGRAAGSCSTFGCTYSAADAFGLLAWVAAATVFIPAGFLGCGVIAAVHAYRAQVPKAKPAEL